MILSMTGYGKGSSSYGTKEINVELKSLNGKTTDIRMRVPANYKQKEMQLRKLIIDNAVRGKIDLSIKIGEGMSEDEFALNIPLIKKYVGELQAVHSEMGLPGNDIIHSIMRIPSVVVPNESELSDEEWDAVKTATLAALTSLKDFRLQEGQSLEKDFILRIGNIKSLLDQVVPFEEDRIVRLKTKLSKHMSQYIQEENVDQNRMEQEIIFYLEKLDVTEEKVRLAQHCEYFIETLNNEDNEIGKKLGFISQEIGREINTLGAKAQHSDIQRIVVNMKDELEKIKEQLANII